MTPIALGKASRVPGSECLSDVCILGTTLWHILTTLAENVPVYSAPDFVLAVTSTIEFEGAAERGDVGGGLITAHGVVRGSSRPPLASPLV